MLGSMVIDDTLSAILSEMGLPSPPVLLLRTVLIRDGYYAGEKHRFEGGYAVWLAQANVIEVYDNAGNLLKTVGVEKADAKKAV